MAGTLRRSPNLRIGYFAQHQAEELDLAAAPLDHMARLEPMATPEQLRALSGALRLRGREALTGRRAVGRGEGAPALALMTAASPHILLLDEPTNHLDMDSREALVEALNGYEGAVILISHDPHLIELTADRLWLVADGTCRSFEGDLEEYRRHLLAERRGAAAEERRPKDNGEEVRAPAGPRRRRRAARVPRRGPHSRP